MVDEKIGGGADPGPAVRALHPRSARHGDAGGGQLGGEAAGVGRVPGDHGAARGAHTEAHQQATGGAARDDAGAIVVLEQGVLVVAAGGVDRRARLHQPQRLGSADGGQAAAVLGEVADHRGGGTDLGAGGAGLAHRGCGRGQAVAGVGQQAAAGDVAVVDAQHAGTGARGGGGGGQTGGAGADDQHVGGSGPGQAAQRWRRPWRRSVRLRRRSRRRSI